MRTNPIKDGKLACNADMGRAEVRQFCELDEVSRSLLRTAARQMQLSADVSLVPAGRKVRAVKVR